MNRGELSKKIINITTVIGLIGVVGLLCVYNYFFYYALYLFISPDTNKPITNNTLVVSDKQKKEDIEIEDEYKTELKEYLEGNMFFLRMSDVTFFLMNGDKENDKGLIATIKSDGETCVYGEYKYSKESIPEEIKIRLEEIEGLNKELCRLFVEVYDEVDKHYNATNSTEKLKYYSSAREKTGVSYDARLLIEKMINRLLVDIE